MTKTTLPAAQDRSKPEASRNVVTWLNDVRRRKYKKTCDLMAQVLGIPTASLPIIPIRLHHEVNDRFHDDVPSLLRAVGDELAMQPAADSKKLRITHFKTDSCFLRADTSVLETLATIQNLGIEISELPMVQMHPTDGRFQEVVSALLDASPPSSALGQNLVSLGAQKTSVYCDTLADAPSLFSGLQTSRSLRAIDVDISVIAPSAGTATRRQIVQWMAFALFCRKALTSVSLSAENMSVRDVEWIEQVALAQDPMVVLFLEEVGCEESLFASTSQVYLFHPNDATDRDARTRTGPRPNQFKSKL